MKLLRRLWWYVRPSPTDVRWEDALVDDLTSAAGEDPDGYERMVFLATASKVGA